MIPSGATTCGLFIIVYTARHTTIYNTTSTTHRSHNSCCWCDCDFAWAFLFLSSKSFVLWHSWETRRNRSPTSRVRPQWGQGYGVFPSLFGAFPSLRFSFPCVFYSRLGVSLFPGVFPSLGWCFLFPVSFCFFPVSFCFFPVNSCLFLGVTGAQKSKWKHIIQPQNMMGSAGGIPAIHICICQILRGPRRGGSLENLGMAIGRRWPIGTPFKSRSSEVVKLWGASTPGHERIHAQLTEWINESMNQWISEPMNQ